MYLKLIISAPETIKIRPDSEDTLTVAFVPAAESTPSYFIAKVKGSSPTNTCRVNGDVKPIECNLTGLKPAAEYTIEAQACKEPTSVVGGADACSQVKETKGMTLPSGDYVFLQMLVKGNIIT